MAPPTGAPCLSEARGGWMGLALPAGWPGGHGRCRQGSTKLHKAPLL